MAINKEDTMALRGTMNISWSLRAISLMIACLLRLLCGAAETPKVQTQAAALDFIRVSKVQKRFVFDKSNSEFKPWGFNYDHDASNRLLEAYWKDEWKSVAGDFQEMKALGANTIRIHLQVSRFMKSAQEVNRESLDQLARLLNLAEANRLYLDVTGLGCYLKKEVPKWYNDMNEAERWDVQDRFWTAVAEICSHSPAVFCYDLRNEPIVSEDKKNRDWTPGEFAGMCFVQRLTLDFAGRSEKQIARAWVDKMVRAIRKSDRRHLITVGAIPWALTWPAAKPLFYSKEVSKNLDFVSLHFYPKKDEVDKALTALAVYNIGKPIVIEEMFPLNCSVPELDEFIEGSKQLAAGWIGFYWGKTISEYRQSKREIADSMALGWLEYFEKKTPEILNAAEKTHAREPLPPR
jgi:cellulase (glycosyl hydrolase family 5)